MEFTTHFELHSQTTRLQESNIQSYHITGLSPSITWFSNQIIWY